MNLTVASDIEEIGNQLKSDVGPLAGSTVLLCGGHGFLGRYFLALFTWLNENVLKEPCSLIVLDNHITSSEQSEDAVSIPNMRFIAHDVIKPLELKDSIDYVIHAAGVASPQYYRKYPLETLEVATIGTKNLLSFGRAHPLKGFLFFSSSEIYGDPDPAQVPTPESYRGNVSCHGPRACYDESKRLGETLCAIFHQLHGVPAKIVRPFNVYGPGMQETDYRVLPNFGSRILKGDPIRVYGTGKQTRTFCYVTDAITGFMKALLRGRSGEAYNIGNPVPEISMLELAKALERAMGRSIPMELVEHPEYYPADEPQRRCPDIAKAKKELAYNPQVNLADGLKRFLGWAQENYTLGESGRPSAAGSGRSVTRH